MSDTLGLIGIALLGTLASSVLALIPALHIYNVVGVLIAGASALSGVLTADQIALLLLGMIIGYAMLSNVPSIFLAAPDESSAFIVLPGQKWLLQQRGYEAAILTGIGALCGLGVLVIASPIAGEAARVLSIIVSPHLGWILAAIIAFKLPTVFWLCVHHRASAGWRVYSAGASLVWARP